MYTTLAGHVLEERITGVPPSRQGSSQILLRICRLTVNDILSWRVSGWELALSVATIVRVAVIMVLGGLNLEMFKMSKLMSVFQGLFILILSL